MIERFFRDLTVKRIRRGVFSCKPKPYLWTAKARDILEKVKRAWMKLRAGGFVPKSGKFAALDSIDLRLAAEGSADSGERR
jgi:hypothetical protein